ncbi:hypothetical protein J6590_089292 [Homalodisca vitripennis]|nr:hypothetical protein J6590_089292 [Homalodisca vitripennis]
MTTLTGLGVDHGLEGQWKLPQLSSTRPQLTFRQMINLTVKMTTLSLNYKRRVQETLVMRPTYILYVGVRAPRGTGRTNQKNLASIQRQRLGCCSFYALLGLETLGLTVERDRILVFYTIF